MRQCDENVPVDLLGRAQRGPVQRLRRALNLAEGARRGLVRVRARIADQAVELGEPVQRGVPRIPGVLRVEVLFAKIGQPSPHLLTHSAAPR